MTDWTSLIVVGLVLTLIQVLAALPWAAWLLSEDRGVARQIVSPAFLGGGAIATVVGGGALAAVMSTFGATPIQEKLGMAYGAVLHLQLVLDLLVGVFAVLLLVWPRGGTVALAAFREGYRQPMFWLLFVGTILFLFASMVIPYFTFGDDFKMMKQLGYDVIMLTTVLFCVLAASISVSDEIEGRTAVTLMSKPVTRRQFLLGKYFGILLAGVAMTLLLGVVFNVVLYFKPYFDRLEDAVDPLVTQAQAMIVTPTQNLPAATEAKMFIRGVGVWAGETYANTLGLALGFGQVMVLLAIAASLATRLPMVVNLVICLVFFFLGHLAPVLVQVSEQLSRTQGGALNLVSFLAQLFDKLLPALEFFSTSQVVIRETQLDLGPFTAYVGSVLAYAGLYSAIALLVGLILFEDRDLA